MIDSKKNYERMSAWKRGKVEQKKFYDISLNRSTNLLTFILGLILGAIVLAPFAIMIFQFIVIFGYNLKYFMFYLLLIWIVLMIFNGLSNYFTVKLAQAKVKDMLDLQAISPRYIFIYQSMNIGFGLFTLFIIVFVGMRLV